jgi:outer membrane protein TolC
MKALLAVVMIMVLAAYAEGGSDVLDDYVNEALANNLGLTQQRQSLERTIAEKREARGLFLPSLGISSRYSRAGGGRSVDFPVGDLVNPIHEALNDLIGEPAFPADVENVSTPFLREEEHETKLTLTQPLVEPGILFNYRMRSDLARSERAAEERYMRDLVRDVKSAYFDYLTTVRIVEMYEETEVLVEENLRVSQSLFENGMATGDVVFRARAELSKIRQEKMEAERDRNLAGNRFNMLLGCELDRRIEVSDPRELPEPPTADFQEARRLARRSRPEMEQLRKAVDAAGDAVGIAASGYLPSVVFALDYGFQGEIYRFTGEDDFWMGSVLLRWNLFDGLSREARLAQARADRRRLEAGLAELEQAIELEVEKALDDMEVAGKSLSAAGDRLASATRSFEIVSRKYNEGMSPQIEYLDARTTMTQAEINLIVTRYRYHSAYAELERVLALYDIGERQ